MDNQFINAPLLVNKSAYTDHKDQLIHKLKNKNSKLKSQLVKIQRTIQQKFGHQQEQTGPKKRQSIFAHEDSFQVLTKQLANTYKRIKMYEYQINKLQNPDKSINVTQKTSQYETMIKEKKAMSAKLKIKLIRENKVVQDNIKKLQGNNQKEQLQDHMKKMTEQAKFYKNKVKDIQQRQKNKAANMKKQYQALKKLQIQLIQAGVAGGQLDQLKRRAVNSIKVNPNQTARNTTMQETKKGHGHGQGHRHDDLYMSGSEDQVQDRTREHYDALLAEVALLQKMQNDHQKQMVRAFDQKIQSVNKNMQSRNRLLQCQNQIQNLQKQIQIIKGKVIPSNLKPTKPLRSLSSHQGQNPNKLLPAKYIGVTPMKTKASHQLSRINNKSQLHQQ